MIEDEYEHEFWDEDIKSCEPDRDLEGRPMVWLQLEAREDLLSEGLMFSIADLEHMLSLARHGQPP